MPKINIQTTKDLSNIQRKSIWDITLILLALCLVFLFSKATYTMGQKFTLGKAQNISLATSALPEYALRSVTRMFYALILSFLATFSLGTLAGKSKYAERIIIPLIDVLQSIPILGFLSIGIPIFFKLFPESMLGPECAAILTIFTSQAWNMILSFYQSLKSIPNEMKAVAKVFELSKWQIFWKIEVPFAMPGLLWNTMLSLSAGWFFVVGSEAFIHSGNEIFLPGIGSYIAKAVDLADYSAIYKALLAMLIVISIYDQIIFRPMLAWAQKFNLKGDHYSSQSSWVLRLIEKTSIKKYFQKIVFTNKRKKTKHLYFTITERTKNIIWQIFLITSGILSIWLFYKHIYHQVSFSIILHIIKLGALTMVRVFSMIILCCFIWTPIGVYIGLRPRLALKVQPFIQFLAAFPTNLLFPLVVGIMIKYNLNINIWSAPLLVLGTQWYILFNVIAGTMSLPEDLHELAKLLKIRDLKWWRYFILPGIFPHLLTGVISAAGGAWNASILAEAISWGTNSLYASGIGAFITIAQKNGNIIEMALAIIVMCLYVILINRFLWQPLYRLSQRHFIK